MSVPRDWLVFIAASTIYLFASATTFQSMGIVLFAMVGEFRWSEAEAGGAFMALVLMCCATSLLPVALIPRIGARWTVVLGTSILALGFLVAAMTTTLTVFYVAAGLFGVAFSLVANTCGIYLTAGWFGVRSSRMIGPYMVCGTLGGAVGPPVAQALVSSAGGWRLHWLLMAALAMAIAVLCALLIREPPVPAARGPEDGEFSTTSDWGYGEALRTPQFALLAAAMVVTQTAIITVSGVTPSHFARLGWPDDFAARMLGLQALIGTVATGISGWLTERYDPKLILAVGLLAESIGMMLLAFADSVWLGYGFTLSFGVGWSVTCLAITVLLIRYFGNRAGPAGLSTLWMLSGIAAVGPSAAGFIADRTGSFVPSLAAVGLSLLPIAGAALFLGSPRRALTRPLVPAYQKD